MSWCQPLKKWSFRFLQFSLMSANLTCGILVRMRLLRFNFVAKYRFQISGALMNGFLVSSGVGSLSSHCQFLLANGLSYIRWVADVVVWFIILVDFLVVCIFFFCCLLFWLIDFLCSMGGESLLSMYALLIWTYEERYLCSIHYLVYCTILQIHEKLGRFSQLVKFILSP